MRHCLTASLSIVFANAAFAHPGHGTADVASGSWLHFVSEPVHLLPLLAVVASAILAIKYGKKSLQHLSRT
jgi:hypothetical protein